MTLLIPLGLLGLISIAGLILIYILKPNYQQKVISSTYIWKLSLKLKKRRIPMSKWRNILLIICQIAILVSCALILAQPAGIIKSKITQREVIAVIDSSASMRTVYDGETRFDRAVNDVISLTDEVFGEDGIVSVIVADNTSSFLAQRATSENKQKIQSELKALSDDDSCSYGSSDINESMALCENVLTENPDAKIYLYTDTTYSYIPDGVTVVNVTDENEWNAAILDARAVKEDNYYTVYVDVACYGRDSEIPVTVEIYNANAVDSNDTGIQRIVLSTSVFCNSDTTKTVIFRNGDVASTDYEKNAENIVFVDIDDSNKFYSYGDIHVSIEGEYDNFSDDDNFDIYNGQKHVLKVQYASSEANSFFPGILETLRDYYSSKKDVWDVQIKEVKSDEAVTEGYDFYIFEHTMPSEMPTDGVVLLSDLYTVPTGLGITLGSIRDYNKTSINLTRESDSALLNYISVGNMTLSRYTEIVSYDPSYELLMSCDTRPVLLAKNDGTSKVIIAPFSLHYANVAIRKDFPTLLFNIFEYFFQPTIAENTFEVYESVSVNSMGQNVIVDSDSGKITLTEFPATLKLDLPGAYTLTQTTDFGKVLEDRIYVKIPASESNIFDTEDTFRNPFLVESDTNYFRQLMVYFAAALVALLFVEWFLQARDNM